MLRDPEVYATIVSPEYWSYLNPAFHESPILIDTDLSEFKIHTCNEKIMNNGKQSNIQNFYSLFLNKTI